jgi:outer membrane protein with beta-barrel domain
MRRMTAGLLVLGSLMALPSPAKADGFVAPFVGVNFGGDTTKNSTVFGGSIGYLGHAAGVEAEFGYTPSFFGDSSTITVTDGKVATFMGNVLIGGRHHAVSPYLALGAGLIRSNINAATDVFDIHQTKNNWGGNVGGGLFVGSGPVTFRGDVRYFKSFDTSGDFPDITGNKLGFWRATGGIGFMW